MGSATPALSLRPVRYMPTASSKLMQVLQPQHADYSLAMVPFVSHVPLSCLSLVPASPLSRPLGLRRALTSSTTHEQPKYFSARGEPMAEFATAAGGEGSTGSEGRQPRVLKKVSECWARSFTSHTVFD